MPKKGRFVLDSKVQCNFRCPPDLLHDVREKIQDPLRNKTKHGDLSNLIVALLYQWLNQDPTNLDSL